MSGAQRTEPQRQDAAIDWQTLLDCRENDMSEPLRAVLEFFGTVV